MSTGFTRSPKLLKGALVKLEEGFLGPIPNVIVFQYNPENLARQFSSSSKGKEEKKDEKAATTTTEPFDPEESFSIKLELDATDALESPEKNPVAAISGVADRIAAIEMLLYPAGKLPGIPTNLPGQNPEPVPKNKVPIVLFIWGPGRVIPVRITSLSIDEQAFSPTLFPIRATATLGLKVLKLESFQPKQGNRTLAEDLAYIAYNYSKEVKETLARLNLLNSGESILAMLPF